MLDVISAPPGTGKTLHCVEIIENEVRKNPNRMIFTNIIGLNIQGVLPITSSANKPFDWRDLPDGSLIIYDEAHEHPAFSKYDLLKNYQLPAVIDNMFDMEVARINDYEALKTFEKVQLLKKHGYVYTELPSTIKIKEKEELIRKVRKTQAYALDRAKEDILDIGRALTMHRHFGFDIILVTQKPDLLNAYVKAATSQHLILRRLFKLSLAIIYSYAEVQDQFGNATRKNALSWRIWFFPKRLYKYYISAESHPVKPQIPMGLLAMVVGALCLIGFATYNTKSSDAELFGASQVTANGQQKTSPDSKQSATNNAKDVTQPSSDLIDLCRMAVNVDTPQCKKFFDDLTNSGGSIHGDAEFVYDGNKPFDVDYTPTDLKPKDFPRFKNAIVYNGKCTAYSQQGTIMHKVSKQDCHRLANGDRPFDYFAEEKPHVQPTSPTSDENYKKSYLENIARLDAERHVKAQDAIVQDEQIPLGTRPPQDISGANSL